MRSRGNRGSHTRDAMMSQSSATNLLDRYFFMYTRKQTKSVARMGMTIDVAKTV
jgi:hypothetical protein